LILFHIAANGEGNNMKTIRNTMVALVAAAGLIPGTSGQAEDTVTSAVSTNGGTTLSWAITTANSIAGGTPVVTFLSATGDTNTSVVQFYRISRVLPVKAVASGTNVSVANTNGFTGTNGWASNDVVVVNHRTGDTYEKLTIYSASNTNDVLHSPNADYLIFSTVPQGTRATGDLIYQLTTTGAPSLPVGSNSVSYSGSIYAGQRGYPIYAEVNGDASATLHLMTVQFIR
jgi:hypothetical protein